MAAEREIKTTLAIDGEKAFKTSISDSTRSLKIMAAELKLNTAEFNLNGSSIDNLTKRREILSKEMDQQKEHVKALTQAVEDSTKRYGESDENTDKYRESLVKAKTALATMENELGANKKALDEFGNKIDDADKKTLDWGNTLKKIGSTLSSGIGAAAKATGAAMAAIGTASIAAAKGIFDLTAGAGKMADELLTTSAQTGISTQALQEWEYAARFIDVEVETMTGSMAKMIKQMAGAKEGTGASAEAFAALGVNITGTNGQLLGSQEVFFASIDALGKVANETERDALSMQLFGKSAQDLNPLIKAGSDELRRLGTEAQSAGLILSGEALGSLGGFDDTMQRIQATMKGVGNNIAMIFLPALQSVASGAQEVMTSISTALKDGFQPEDIATIGQAIAEKLSAGMQKITEFLPQIITTVSGVLSQLVNSAVAFLPTLLPQLMTAAVALLTGALQAIKDNIKKIAETVVILVKGFVKFITDNLPMVIEVAIEIILALVKGLIGAIPDLIKAIPSIITAFVNGIVNNIPVIIECGKELVRGLFAGIKALGDWFWQELKNWAKEKLGWLADLLGIKSPSTFMRDMIGKPMVQGMALGITQNSGLIDKAMAGLVPSALHTNVSMDVTRRLNDITNSTARSNSSLASEIISGFRAVMAEHNSQIIVLNDREMGRMVRSFAV